MKAWHIVIFILALNLVSSAVSHYTDLGYSQYTAINEDEFNPDNYDWNQRNVLSDIPIVGDIVSGYNWVKQVTKDTIMGFPTMLENIGAPPEIVTLVKILTGVAYIALITFIITGRNPEV